MYVPIFEALLAFYGLSAYFLHKLFRKRFIRRATVLDWIMIHGSIAFMQLNMVESLCIHIGQRTLMPIWGIAFGANRDIMDWYGTPLVFVAWFNLMCLFFYPRAWGIMTRAQAKRRPVAVRKKAEQEALRRSRVKIPQELADSEIVLN